jgi:catechol 2,3-dioxygenase-like lactoylglutathione lyase family enzyme
MMETDRRRTTSWPSHLRPGAVRWARASAHYDETIAFYRDVVGLPVVDEFSGSFGEDGTIFGLPDTSVQMEIVRAHATNGSVGGFDQLVLYLDNADAVEASTARLRDHGLQPHPSPHPYWHANGAVSYRDPDGRDVVFAPWVSGRDPEPADHGSSAVAPEVHQDLSAQPSQT